MSAQIQHYGNGSIGRMFARQNVPSVYGKQKQNAEAPAAEEDGALVDRVSLSPDAPKPLDAAFMEDAFRAGETIASGGALSGEDSERLRMDRVFAAVSALSLLGKDGEGAVSWPGGFPVPSQAELEAARRRLAQRPQNTEQAANPSHVQAARQEILDRVTRRDFARPAFAPMPEAAAS